MGMTVLPISSPYFLKFVFTYNIIKFHLSL